MWESTTPLDTLEKGVSLVNGMSNGCFRNTSKDHSKKTDLDLRCLAQLSFVITPVDQKNTIMESGSGLNENGVLDITVVVGGSSNPWLFASKKRLS